jgi:hypothetical protein
MNVKCKKVSSMSKAFFAARNATNESVRVKTSFASSSKIPMRQIKGSTKIARKVYKSLF